MIKIHKYFIEINFLFFLLFGLVLFLKSKEKKLAPALYYLATKALCEQANFCMSMQNGVLGFWDSLCPLYPVLNEQKNITFHSIPWQEKFCDYYKEYVKEQEENSKCNSAVCGEIPPNFILISINPFTCFDSCSFSLKNAKGYFSPMLFMGKYEEAEGKYLMPVSFTFHHAVADGYHAQIFFDTFQRLLKNPRNWWEETEWK